MSTTDYEQPLNQVPCDHQMASGCYRQRRVHSVSQIECTQNTSSPHFSRALSCSPTCTSPLQASPFAAANYQFQIPPSAPSRDQPHKMTTFGHVETLKERLTGKSSSSHQPKTSSQTSLLSSSSEQSMDCNLQLLPMKSDVLTTINQDGSGDGAGSSSNMSLGSDYSATPGSKTEEKPGKTGKVNISQDP